MIASARTLLVANRGEIAIRVFGTARRMGLRTIAVYSDADAGAPHVRAADAAVRIGPPPAAESYLDIDAIIAAATDSGAGLLHPGYGFLAEDHRLARACEELGIGFVGPRSEVLRLVGDKAAARILAGSAGVPVFPGYAGDDQSDATLVREAERIGLPLLVKPAAGGGGKGMVVVRDPAELSEAIASARRVSLGAFGDDRLILETLVAAPRHVEVQVLADAHGRVVHLGERDCSLQRRHQKILEEAPAPNLDDAMRERLHAAAVAFARRAGYVGAGTCEFLVSRERVGFIEMNARLQVEHPVTEMVTSLDLVELQLRVAMGEALPFDQADVPCEGHAIEARVYAEDPAEGFLPQAGRIEHLRWPQEVRVDTGIEEGTVVPPHYDPLLAKVVVHGTDRADALARLRDALDGCEVLGPRTNITFLSSLARDDAVVQGRVTTDLLDAVRWGEASAVPAEALAVAAAAEVARAGGAATSDPWVRIGAWRASAPALRSHVVLRAPDETVICVDAPSPYTVGGHIVEQGAEHHAWLVDGARAAAVRTEDVWLVWLAGQHEIAVGPATRRLTHAAARLEAPLPGQVIAVLVEPGQRVEAGQELVVVEAMKMEHAVRAPGGGTVRAVLCAAGDQVDRGRPLVDLEAEEEG